MCPSPIQSSSAYSMRDRGNAHGGMVTQAPLSESPFPGSCCSYRPCVFFSVSPSIQGARALQPAGTVRAVGDVAGSRWPTR